MFRLRITNTERDSSTDLVEKIRYSYDLVETIAGKRVESSSVGIVDLTQVQTPQGYVVTPFNQLEENTLSGWVRMVLGQEVISIMESRLQVINEAKKAPKTFYGLPWSEE
jgi:hypothetical protein